MAQSALATRSGMIFDTDDVARDPFGAYVADDATATAAQAVARQRGWSAGAVRRGTLDSARRLLGVAPPPQFLIVDIDGLPIEEVDAGLDRDHPARLRGDRARHGQRRQLLPPDHALRRA